MATKTQALEQQTILDLAIQEYGSVEGALLLIQDNPGMVDFQKRISAGKLFVIQSNPIDKDVRDYFKNNGYNPVSADEKDTLPKDFNNDFNNDFN